MKEENVIRLVQIGSGLAVTVLSVVTHTNHILYFIGGVLMGVPAEIFLKLKGKEK